MMFPVLRKFILNYACMYIYIYLYMVSPPMDPGLVFDLYLSSVLCLSCFLHLCQNWGKTIVYMIRMHAYRCDKSNDIGICNLKEFECIREYKNNSDIVLSILLHMGFT